MNNMARIQTESAMRRAIRQRIQRRRNADKTDGKRVVKITKLT